MVLKKYRKVIFWLLTLALLLVGSYQLTSVATSEKPSNIVINEFLAANATGWADEDGDASDWLEIYNPGEQPLNLAGYALTDDPQQPAKWRFPELTLDGGDYLVIFASGKNRRQTQPEPRLHTNFKLDRAGEFLGLYNLLADEFVSTTSFDFSQQFKDIAYGRYGNKGHYGYLAIPTPGQPNDETVMWAGLTEPVTFSVVRGFYDHPFTVALTTTTPSATIHYTLNGSEPTETTGLIYDQPVLISGTTLLRAIAFRPDFLSSEVETHSYIFLDDVLRQPAQPAGFPTTWGVHAIDFAGYTAGSPVVADYEVDPELVNDPRYKDSLKTGLIAIPTLSIVTDVQNFYLYANPRERGVLWERPASVELIYPQHDRDGFQINAGVRMQGGAGRWEFMPKHSFRLFFKEQYGATKLNYPLFPNSPVESFDTLILRAGVDRSYAGHPDTQDQRLTTYTRDEWLRASQIEMSGVGSHGIFVHLYLNGLYWGLYNIVERPDASFAAAYFEGAKEEWYAVNHRGGISGSSDHFRHLLSLAEAGQLDQPQKYAEIQAYLDIDHFADYLILNWYAGSKDWPENNWYANVHNVAAGRVRYFVWDGEESWNDGAEIHLGQADLAGRPNTIKILFEALLKNPDFKLTLADRMYKHLFNNGALTDANAQARWLSINAPIEPAIIGESLRWGDARYEPPITPEDWLQARDNVLTQMEGNNAKFIAQARSIGYYPKIDPPLFNQMGGLIEPGFALTMQTPTGPIYYTSDGTDPRLTVSGEVALAAVHYDRPVVLTTTTAIKARILVGETWSALHEATFRVSTPPGQLRITELMYHPQEPEGDDYEFIELKNISVSDVTLAGASFEGLKFTFPLDTKPLAPQTHIVLVRNEAAFQEKYPNVPIAGVYEGQLSNKGEKITLTSVAGEVLTTLEYDDENGWPLSPDGRGDSLVLINPTADPNDPQNWRASRQAHGSPGTDELIP